MTELAIVPQIDFQETLKLGEVLAKSGFFKDTREASQAVVKVLAGQELGIGPVASMGAIHIVQGKPSLSANIIAAKVKASGRYNYRVPENTDEACEIAFYENGEEVGRSRFTMKDAAAAGLASKDIWKKYPRNMLFARAMSNGARWYCPDAFAGITVYTPEELGAEVDGDGDVIDVTPARMPEPQPEPAAQQLPQRETQRKGGNGHQYAEIQDRAKAMLNAVNDKTLGRYNAIPHLLNAIRLEFGDKDWVWPELDDEDGWAAAYKAAIAHAEKEAA